VTALEQGLASGSEQVMALEQGTVLEWVLATAQESALGRVLALAREMAP